MLNLEKLSGIFAPGPSRPCQSATYGDENGTFGGEVDIEGKQDNRIMNKMINWDRNHPIYLT